jgi:hypothetical protein
MSIIGLNEDVQVVTGKGFKVRIQLRIWWTLTLGSSNNLQVRHVFEHVRVANRVCELTKLFELTDPTFRGIHAIPANDSLPA